LSAPTDNQIYTVPDNQFSPSAGTTLVMNTSACQPERRHFGQCFVLST